MLIQELKNLKEGLYDAIILSLAGIKSLKLNDQISEIFSVDEIIPSAGQGIMHFNAVKMMIMK